MQWDRFMKGIDYDGLADVRVTGWQRKLHIFQIPFYYVEYGLAQIGAVQVWMNSLQDATKATADYRRAGAGWHGATSRTVRCGGGARFAMDSSILRTEVDALMETIEPWAANSRPPLGITFSGSTPHPWPPLPRKRGEGGSHAKQSQASRMFAPLPEFGEGTGERSKWWRSREKSLR
ncbi:MAG: hypothetical protein IPK19_18660 [Chloroflexi bacterium]|nr:hypothetical protein [Chloroflexota bacterium]